MKKFTMLSCFVFFTLLLSGCGAVLYENVDLAAQRLPEQKVSSETPAVDPAAKWRNLDVKKYPNADTILLDDLEETAYNSDGTYSSRDESWTLIVTEAGRKDCRSIAMHFNEFYKKIPQVDIEVIKPDGSVVKPVLQKNITVDSSQMQSNIFDPAQKILTIGIPDLEIGDIIHVISQVKAIKPRMQGVWCDWVNLQGVMPVLRYKYVISAPETMPLKSIAVKDEVKGALTRNTYKKDGRIFYEFESKDVPQFLPEVDMPPWYLHSMRVLTSTAPDWRAVSRWYYNLCEPRLKAVSPELTAFARKLVEGKQGKAAIRAVFDYVSKEIRYTGVTNENTAPGYEPHDVKETFAQKHGVCRDKAALLAAMLREVGFDAFMVLFMAGDPKDEEIPNYFFNHAITGVKMPDGELVLMDGTDENSSDLLPAYAMNKSFLCATKAGDVLRRTPVIPPEKNMLNIKSSGVINEKFQLELKSVLTFYGINDNIYRDAFANWDSDYRKQFFASVLKRALPGAELVKLTILPENVRDLAKTLQVVLECKVPDYVDINFGDGIVKTPFLSGNFGALSFMLGDKMLEKRKYPLQMFSTAGVYEECKLQLPESLTLTALPDYKNIDNAVLKVNTAVSRNGNTLNTVRSIKLKKLEIQPAEYSQFRNTVLDITAAGQGGNIVKRNLLNKGIIASGVPAMVENYQYSIIIDEKKNIVCNETKRIKILNYKGIKEYSELALHFVEGISKSEFISGRVISPDGKIAKVDPASGKVMDDGVSDDAPRYPAGKRVIIPLPDVKVNSIIEYTIATKVFADENFTALADLYDNLPVKNAVIEFRYPARLQKAVQMALPDAGFKVEKYREKNMIICKLYANNVPVMPVEPSAPANYLFAPYAGITLFNGANYGSKVRAAIEKAAKNSTECSKLALKLTGNITDKIEKIRIIRNFVAKNIRSAGHELDTLGIKHITPADIVLQDNYGNSADRAVVLFAMLKAIGITNVEIILGSNNPYLPEYLSQFTRLPANMFSKVILSVKADGREFFLNDNNEYSPLEYTFSNNSIGLNTDNGELIMISPAPGFDNQIRQDWLIKILPEGKAEFNVAASYYGKNYVAFNEYFANVKPEAERQFWEQQFSGETARAENKVITRDFKLYPGVIKMSFTIPDFWKKSGDYVVFTLPASGIDSLVRTAGNRTLPYIFAPKTSMQMRYNVDLPASWQSCEFMGGVFNFKNLSDSSVVKQSADFTPGLLEVKTILNVPDVLYLEPQAYKILEDLQKKLANPSNRTFLFKTSGK